MNNTNQNETKGPQLLGVISVSARGTATVFDDKRNIYFIDFEDRNRALHGDTIKFEWKHKNRGRTYAKVVSVEKRGRTGFAGTIVEKNNVLSLHPDDPKIDTDFEIIKDDKKIKLGMFVYATLDSWEIGLGPKVKIERILGETLTHNALMEGIVLERGFDPHFPPEVVAEADIIERRGITEEDLEGRRDIRGIFTCTIDPVDAKDFDDALSFRELPNGHYEIGVHIADVSHFVRQKTALDQEAYNRATSVYLVDRTIPMLPSVLSDNLCSLVPKQDRLTFSAIMEMDLTGKIYDKWIGKTVIHSDRRFSYEEAGEIMEKEAGEYSNELVTLNKIAKELYKERRQKGTLSLEGEEYKFRLDDNGFPVDVYKKVRGDSHKMIEEFMLLANKVVAEFIKEKTGENIFVYRIHDMPDRDRVRDLVHFVSSLGYSMKKEEDKISIKDFSALVEMVKDKPEQAMVESLVARTMAKAIYSTKNIGHYGLGFEDYTHFTSPIRRYPDLIVHRLLQTYLTGKHIEKESWKWYEKASLHSSEREKQASEAERTSIKTKQVEYMSSYIGQDRDGIITGVTAYGFFVADLISGSEGFVHVSNLPKEEYEFDEKKYTLSSPKRKFRLGDKIKVRVLKADPISRTVDYGFFI